MIAYILGNGIQVKRSGKFTVISQTPINAIDIFRLQGTKIFSKQKFNQQTYTEIDLSSRFKGTYIVKVSSGNNILTKKVIVF
jgi:hypothetical protein